MDMKKTILASALCLVCLNAMAVPKVRDGAEGSATVRTTISTSYQPLVISAQPKNVNKDPDGKVANESVLATISISDPNGDSATAAYCFFSADSTSAEQPLKLYVTGDDTKSMDVIFVATKGNTKSRIPVFPVSDVAGFRTSPAGKASACVSSDVTNISMASWNGANVVAGGEYSTVLQVLSIAP